jgi:hypothetical protein
LAYFPGFDFFPRRALIISSVLLFTIPLSTFEPWPTAVLAPLLHQLALLREGVRPYRGLVAFRGREEVAHLEGFHLEGVIRVVGHHPHRAMAYLVAYRVALVVALVALVAFRVVAFLAVLVLVVTF